MTASIPALLLLKSCRRLAGEVEWGTVLESRGTTVSSPSGLFRFPIGLPAGLPSGGCPPEDVLPTGIAIAKGPVGESRLRVSIRKDSVVGDSLIVARSVLHLADARTYQVIMPI
jgi:hypothetical protein